MSARLRILLVTGCLVVAALEAPRAGRVLAQDLGGIARHGSSIAAPVALDVEGILPEPRADSARGSLPAFASTAPRVENGQGHDRSAARATSRR